MRAIYKKILVQINDDFISERAAYFALKVARELKSHLILCFIHERGQEFEKGERLLKKYFLEAEREGLKVEALIKEGRSLEILEDLIKKEAIDLLFVPGEGSKKLDQLLCSIAIVKIVNLGKLHPKRILFLLKGNLPSWKENAYLIETFYHAFKTKVFLVCCGKSKNFSKLLFHLEKAGVKMDMEFYPSFSYNIIIFQILSKRADLLILEKTDRRILGFLGRSESQKLIRETPCNLIIFRPFSRHEN